eukprot:TRINITY_DN3143_c0_g1_i2.p1 TRINITY_DN3143_c0_g1~~TRINITY_DN3143_c0_g1_i2.p1  ORF type:complete len:164 (+),score=35.41 TRINITY_DN3143_c0_g1_i2:556-1047(+)
MIETPADQQRKNKEQKILIHLAPFDKHWTPKCSEDDASDSDEALSQQPVSEYYNHVISSIPLTRVPLPVLKEILSQANSLLKPGGTFIYLSLCGARPIGYWGAYLKTLLSRDQSILKDYEEKLRLIDSWSQENFTSCSSTWCLNLPLMNVFALKKKDEPKKTK